MDTLMSQRQGLNKLIEALGTVGKGL